MAKRLVSALDITVFHGISRIVCYEYGYLWWPRNRISDPALSIRLAPSKATLVAILSGSGIEVSTKFWREFSFCDSKFECFAGYW